MNCPRCNQKMANLGNQDGAFSLEGDKPAWCEVHVCHDCRLQSRVRVELNLPRIPLSDADRLVLTTYALVEGVEA